MTWIPMRGRFSGSGEWFLSREKLFSTFENRILIKYTLLDAHSPTTLRFKPFMAFLNVNDLTFENGIFLSA